MMAEKPTTTEARVGLSSEVLIQGKLEIILDNASNSRKPFVLFDDDGDGICAFLQLYKFFELRRVDLSNRWSVLIKKRPVIENRLLDIIGDKEVDKVFILDIVGAEEKFFRGISNNGHDNKKPKVQDIIWIDHHNIGKENQNLLNKKITYINPRINNIGFKPPYFPTSAMMYEAFKQDSWIAAIGYLSDGALPLALVDLTVEYPELIENIQNRTDLLKGQSNLREFILWNKYGAPSNKTNDLLNYIREETILGDLIKIFNYALKGTESDKRQNIKLLTKIDNPYQLFDKNRITPEGKRLIKYYLKIKAKYEEMQRNARNNVQNLSGILYYDVKQEKYDFMTQIATKFISESQASILIVADEDAAIGDNAYIEMSLRALKEDLTKIIKNIEMKFREKYPKEERIFSGGGHSTAAGASIKKKYLPEFKRYIREMRIELAFS